MNFKQSDFTYEEDSIISAECEDCGNHFDTDDECEKCTECGSDNLIYETSHENCKCSVCGCLFDMHTDVYRHDKDSDVMICLECYEELEEE